MTNFYLSDFITKLPQRKLSQEESIDHLVEVHGRNLPEGSDRIRSLVKRYAVKPSMIAYRYTENLDLAKNSRSILNKTQFFSERAGLVVEELYENVSAPPDHIVHVSCTGYVSPSAVQSIVIRRGWQQTTGVTHAYHMGCYASLPAVRMAKALAADGNERVDIVHNEMCTLHLDLTDHSPEQIVVQSLFADGHIKYSGTTKTPSRGFRVLAIKELILPDSQKDMSWILADFGMRMSLSREVPHKISEHLRDFLQDLCERAGLDRKSLTRESIFAVHPGGPKIIDAVHQGLELKDEQVEASRAVLKERGNMSSATLPHVWMKLLEGEYRPGRKVISFAFGPGLTIFGAVFESV